MNSSEPVIDTLAVIGVGLIGGSFALALREAGAVRHIVGFGRSADNLQLAIDRGIIDAIAQPDALRRAQVIVVAVPVGQIPDCFRQIVDWDVTGIVTDVGSTKQDVIAQAERLLGSRFRFVPAHPIAGTERSGAGAADAKLFHNKNVVLTPTDDTDSEALATIARLWESTGAKVRKMPAAEHDAVFAAVSHLPHLLAYTLMTVLASKPRPEAWLEYAAGGFRDFTRIASSNPEMWRDISVSNRAALLTEIDAYQDALNAVKHAVASSDADALNELFRTAREAREQWLQQVSRKDQI